MVRRSAVADAKYARQYYAREKRRDPERLRLIRRRWKQRNPEKVRDCALRYKYGISSREYDRLLRAQGNGCAICGSDTPRYRNRKFFHVDHDHRTGKVRGLLCHPCNMLLGYVKDSVDKLQAAVEYLRRN